LAFNIGGFSDIIENLRCGLLVESLDPASLSSGLHYFYRQHLARGPGMRAAARQRAEEHFDTRKNAQQYAELYDQIFSG
jgi:glycosyltransferase involved in cell wall biosynthesis